MAAQLPPSSTSLGGDSLCGSPFLFSPAAHGFEKTPRSLLAAFASAASSRPEHLAEKRSNCHSAGGFCRRNLLSARRSHEQQLLLPPLRERDGTGGIFLQTKKPHIRNFDAEAVSRRA